MTLHIARGAKVQAHEVTESNLEKLAEAHGGTVHTSVREAGQRFLTFESEDGTLRVNVGGYVIVDPDDESRVIDGYSDPEAFAAAYERP